MCYMNLGLYIDHLTCGLAYPDNEVQISISYICIQLYTNVSTRSHIAKSMTQHVAQDVVKVLHSTSVVELHINLLGNLIYYWQNLLYVYISKLTYLIFEIVKKYDSIHYHRI